MMSDMTYRSADHMRSHIQLTKHHIDRINETISSEQKQLVPDDLHITHLKKKRVRLKDRLQRIHQLL